MITFALARTKWYLISRNQLIEHLGEPEIRDPVSDGECEEQICFHEMGHPHLRLGLLTVPLPQHKKARNLLTIGAVETGNVHCQWCWTCNHIYERLWNVDSVTSVLFLMLGAFDLVSRFSMLRGLQGVEGGGSVLPFVRQFYGSPSSFLWDDACGNTHDIFQGEGGEQGDPLMPALYSLGQHRALEAVARRLYPTERLFAFLDDLYVVCRPDRVVDVQHILAAELWSHAKIQILHGKTQVWNRGGVESTEIETLQAAAQVSVPDALVWRGDPTLPEVEQGMKILGTPLGHPIYVQSFLSAKTR